MEKYLKGFVESVDKEAGVLSVAVATDLSEDRDGEVVNPDGLDFNNFMRNPVLLWAHNYHDAPIGKVLELKRDGNRMLFKPQFAVGISEKAKQIFDLYSEGYLNAFSIGFIPKEKEGNIFTKAELLEISCVPVPANPNALVLARSKGYDPALLKELEDAASEDKTAIPYHDYGTAEEGMAWDGPAQVRACGDDIAKLKSLCAWFDASKPDVKASYKLPHHMADGKKAVWRGVRAAMGVLMGARGGVDIPDDERRGVYNHLAKHYAQFGKEAPEFRMVEQQILKDLDESPSAEATPTEGAGAGKPERSKEHDEVVLNAKRVLQEIDKAVGQAIREIKLSMTGRPNL